MSRAPLQLLLVEVAPMWRAGLSATLPDWIPQVQIQSLDGLAETLPWLELHNADVLIMDWPLARERGHALLREIAHRHPRVPVVLLHHDPSPMHVHEAKRAGVAALLNERITIARLSGALYQVHSGLSVFDGDEVSETRTRLTPREIDVLRELGQGLCNKTIGARLGITEATLKSHLRTLYDKFSVNNRTACVLEARRNGIL